MNPGGLEATDADHLIFTGAEILVAASTDENLRPARALHPFTPDVGCFLCFLLRFLHDGQEKSLSQKPRTSKT